MEICMTCVKKTRRGCLKVLLYFFCYSNNILILRYRFFIYSRILLSCHNLMCFSFFRIRFPHNIYFLSDARLSSKIYCQKLQIKRPPFWEKKNEWKLCLYLHVKRNPCCLFFKNSVLIYFFPGMRLDRRPVVIC